MKFKVLNIVLVLTSLTGYLEWGGGNSAFLIQTEIEIFAKLFSDPSSVLHPFTLLPLLGQVLLIGSLFQKEPGKVITFSGIGCIGILFLLMLFIGLIGLNFKILLSTIPFLALSVYTIRYHIKNKSVS